MSALQGLEHEDTALYSIDHTPAGVYFALKHL